MTICNYSAYFNSVLFFLTPRLPFGVSTAPTIYIKIRFFFLLCMVPKRVRRTIQVFLYGALNPFGTPYLAVLGYANE